MFCPVMFCPVMMVLLLLTTPKGESEVRFRFQAPGGDFATGRFEIIGLGADTLAALKDKDSLKKALFVGVTANQAILGSHGIKGGVLWFAPRFPVPAEVEHIIRLDLATLLEGKGKPRQWRYTLDAAPTPKTMVEAVYPSGETIPENTLRFYIHFTQPMKKGQAALRVRLLNAKGIGIELPFLELDEELWDAQQTRLTLLIDPGRIKRGLKPLEEEGPVLEMGKTYTLEIERAFEDASGKPLAKGFRKSFKVEPAVRERINPLLWKVVPPQTAMGYLEIRLNRALDHALLLGQMRIENQQDQVVSGSWESLAFETVARFRPKEPWVPGQYRLKPGSHLEDPSGNRIDRVFDAGEKEKPGQSGMVVPFTVKP